MTSAAPRAFGGNATKISTKVWFWRHFKVSLTASPSPEGTSISANATEASTRAELAKAPELRADAYASAARIRSRSFSSAARILRMSSASYDGGSGLGFARPYMEGIETTLRSKRSTSSVARRVETKKRAR